MSGQPVSGARIRQYRIPSYVVRTRLLRYSCLATCSSEAPICGGYYTCSFGAGTSSRVVSYIATIANYNSPTNNSSTGGKRTQQVTTAISIYISLYKCTQRLGLQGVEAVFSWSRSQTFWSQRGEEGSGDSGQGCDTMERIYGHIAQLLARHTLTVRILTAAEIDARTTLILKRSS